MGDNGGVRFLSGEWLDRLAESMVGMSPDAAMAASPPAVRLSIHQRVTGGPDGDVEYTIRLDGGRATVEAGPGQADVEMIEDYETAAAISQGRLSPAAAFASGRLRLGGAVGSLVEHQEAMAALGSGLSGLAGTTTY
jgi:putative sterol carrier protein